MATGTITLQAPADAPPFHTIIKKGKTDPKNTIKLKKMLIADPSIGFELAFDYTSSEVPNELALFLRIGVEPHQSPQEKPYHTDIGVYVPAGKALDLSGNLVFVVPFVDPNFNQEASHYYFDLKVQGFKDGRENMVFDASFDNESVPVADVKRSGHFVVRTGPEGTGTPPWLSPSNGDSADDVRYSDVWFHERGGTYRVDMPDATKDAMVVNNLKFVHNDMPSQGSVASLNAVRDGEELQFDMTVPTFVWLPHGKVVGEAFETSGINLEVGPWQLDPQDPNRHIFFSGIGNLSQSFALSTLPNDEVVIKIDANGEATG